MFCEYCGAKMSDHARFCAACGMKVGAQPAAEGAEPAPADATRGFPPQGQTQPFNPAPQHTEAPVPQNTDVPPQQPSGRPMVDPVPEQFPDEPPKKSGRAGIVIVVVVGIIAVIAAFVVFVLPILREKDPAVTEPDGTSEAVQTTVQTVAPGGETATSESATDGPSQTVQKYAPGNYRNTAISEINLRETPARSANKVGEVRVGETAVITEVYEDISAGSKERWWGKTTVRGVTGWVALYYMSCTDLQETVLDNALIPGVLEKLKGYWNTQDGKRFFAVELVSAGYLIKVGPWYSTLDYVAYCTAPVSGDLNGLLSLHLYYPGSDGEIPMPAIDGTILLDVSEIENGRLVWGNGGNWEECLYAGATADDARPPLPEEPTTPAAPAEPQT